MKYAKVILSLIIVAIFAISCAKKDDETEIQSLLESSWYVGDGAVQTQDDSTNTPKGIGGMQILTDTIGYVRWVRWIQRPVTREFDIVINGDSAFVTITAYFQGDPPGYGLFVNNDPSGAVYQRSIADSVIRRVKLYRDENGKWRIASLTVADIYTVGTDHPVTITEIRAKVASRNYEWVVNSPDTYFEKDQLPIFYPSDTVEVTVTCSCQADSTWAFLHHGHGHRPGVGHPHRDPFYRENTTTFTRTWVIADDSVITTPAVRHSATDVLGWQTLWGDSTATYYSRAWCIPYIVKTPQEEIPSDE